MESNVKPEGMWMQITWISGKLHKCPSFSSRYYNLTHAISFNFCTFQLSHYVSTHQLLKSTTFQATDLLFLSTSCLSFSSRCHNLTLPISFNSCTSLLMSALTSYPNSWPSSYGVIFLVFLLSFLLLSLPCIVRPLPRHVFYTSKLTPLWYYSPLIQIHGLQIILLSFLLLLLPSIV